MISPLNVYDHPHPPSHRLWLLSQAIAYCNCVGSEVPDIQCVKICRLARRTKSAAAPNQSKTGRGSILEMTKWFVLIQGLCEKRCCCGYRFTSCASTPSFPSSSHVPNRLTFLNRRFLCQVVVGWWCRVVEATTVLHKRCDRIWRRLTCWWHIC